MIFGDIFFVGDLLMVPTWLLQPRNDSPAQSPVFEVHVVGWLAGSVENHNFIQDSDILKQNTMI